MPQLLTHVQPGQIITSDMWNLAIDAINGLLQTGQTPGIVIASVVPPGTESDPIRVATTLQVTGQSFGYSVGQTSVSFEASFGTAAVPFEKLLGGSSDSRLLLQVPAMPGLPSTGATMSLRVSNGLASDVRTVQVVPLIIPLQGNVLVTWRSDVSPNPSPNPLAAGQSADFAYQIQAAGTNMPATFDLTADVPEGSVAIPADLSGSLLILDAANQNQVITRLGLGRDETRNVIVRIPSIPAGLANQSFTLRGLRAGTGSLIGADARTFPVGQLIAPSDPNIQIDPVTSAVFSTAGVQDTTGQTGSPSGTSIQLKPNWLIVVSFNVTFKQAGNYDVFAVPGIGSGWTPTLLATTLGHYPNMNAGDSRPMSFSVTAAANSSPAGRSSFASSAPTPTPIRRDNTRCSYFSDGPQQFADWSTAMTVNIPQAGGVPGIPGPPDWIAGDTHLDDVRWNGSVRRSFSGGTATDAIFRAIQVPSALAGQHDLYLSFRAFFVPLLSTGLDYVYLGVQKKGSTSALLVQIQAHDASNTAAGPPSGNPPGSFGSVVVYTWNGASWVEQAGAAPTWISGGGRLWLQNDTDVPTDLNNRWAVQLKIPGSVAPDITNNAGPNLGGDLLTWYLAQGTAADGSAIILGENRIDGANTTHFQLLNGQFPTPSATVWDELQLTTGPASFGGVALDWNDVVVQNAAYGEGWTIANGQGNTFVARPRNYQPAGDDIPPGNINATFRIANFGSIAGDPNQPNYPTGTWNYVPGNDALTPVDSSLDVPPLAGGSNPPATNPISVAAVMNLPAGDSLHQCMLVTLDGTNLTFLNDSMFQNMHYDHASLLERDAEINVIGAPQVEGEDGPPETLDVYMAVEHINMLPTMTPVDEGQFLAASTQRLIAEGGPLAEKLKNVQASLAVGGDFGSALRLAQILKSLEESLEQLKYAEPELLVVPKLLAELAVWLPLLKVEGGLAAQTAADVFNAIMRWLTAPAQPEPALRTNFVSHLGAWLRGVGSDPATKALPLVGHSVLAWLSSLAGAGEVRDQIAVVQQFFIANGPQSNEASVVDALGRIGPVLADANPPLPGIVATFGQAASLWLKGDERLQAFVRSLSAAGATETELDRLFPTYRVHVYHATGETFTGADGNTHQVLRTQSSFGVRAYHEGELEGWQHGIQGAQRIADNMYLMQVPTNGTARITVRVQGLRKGDERLPEDPIAPPNR